MLDAAIPRKSNVFARFFRSLRLPLNDPFAVCGLLIYAVFVLTAIFADSIAPYDPTATLGIPGQAPGNGYLMGLDFIGRDVWSRVLYGGRSTLVLAVLATLVTYLVGGAIGLVAGFSRSALDPVLMRIVDILLSMPALLVMLLLITALNNSFPVLVLATSLVLLPGVARIVRSATLIVGASTNVDSGVTTLSSSAPAIVTILNVDPGMYRSWYALARSGFSGSALYALIAASAASASCTAIVFGSKLG